MDKRISALDAVQSLQDTDVLPIVNGNQTRKVSISQIKASIPTPASPSLQQVTDVNNLTNNPIISKVGFETIIDGETEDISFIGAMSINVGGIISNKGLITLRENGNGSGNSVLLTTESLSADRSITLPNKNGIIAMTSDVPLVDAIPTDSSTNAVSSNGVFDALANKVDKVAGKGLSTNDYTTTEQTKLAGIQAGAEVNVNADWNATTGDALILNKPTIPAAVTQTSQLTNNGADGVNPFITALDIPTTGQASTLVREVKNMTGATLTKGTVVYISGANGNKALVSKALATTDALSSRTFGLLQSNILNNGLGNCVIIGDLSGLDTSSFAEGAQLYLSGVTAGTYTDAKILAPTHLVYVGKVTRSHPTQGQIEVQIQNGYELSEIHDVSLSTPTNDQVLAYDSATSLWKNKTIGGTPLIRQEFTYSGAQTFTLSNAPSAIYIVFVNGQELKQSQYSLATNVLTILNTLETADKVSIIYTATLGGVLDYYTKAQTDAKSILTASPLQGGGDLSANRTISIPMADADYDGYLSSSAFNNFNAKQDAIILTTNNFSGQSTLVGNTLNIPNYEGFIPKLKGHETFRGVNFSNNSTTEVTSGGVTMSTTASAIARSVSSTNFATKQIRKGFYGTVVSAGRYTGIRGTALLWFMGGGFKYVCDVYISDTAFGSGCRQFYGLAGQTTDLGYSDTILVSSLTNIIGVGSDALDANLQIFHNDATGTATKVDLGINFPANRTAGAELTTIYSIQLYNDSASTSVKYSVTNKETGAIATGTIATNLPLHTQGLNFFASRCMGAGVTNTGQFDLLTLGTYSI